MTLVGIVSRHRRRSSRSRPDSLADQYLHSYGRCDQKPAQYRRIRSRIDMAITSIWSDWFH